MEDITDEGRRKNPPIFLHPESILPYPKHVIGGAFILLFEEFEKRGKEEILGLSKDRVAIVAMTLDEDFAPDEEIPADTRLNIEAYMLRRRKLYPDRPKYKMTVEELNIFVPGWFESLSKGTQDKFVKFLNSQHD